MAVTDDVSLCNLALSKIGHKQITSLSDTGDIASIHCNVLFEPERDALLGSHPWNFAMRRVNFDVDDFSFAISAATQANPVVVTSAAHGLSAGDSCYIWDVSGMTELNEELFVLGSNSSATDLELYKQDRTNTINGTSYTAYTSGGYVRPAPVSEYDYMFPLPSDCLMVRILHPDTTDFKVEDGFILTNLDDFEAEYVYQNTTVTDWSALFIQALATKIGAELIGALEASISKSDAFAMHERVLKEAKRINAVQKHSRDHGHRYDPGEDYGWQKAGK